VATRGAQGGLSRQADSIADVLDAAGFDVVLVESVGVGQAELDIAAVVDTVVVVLVPESGDEVQAMKAGLLEIADILCVNKADRAAADALYSALKHSLTMRSDRLDELPVVIRSTAIEAEGVAELIGAAEEHRARLEATGAWSRLRDRRLRRRVEMVVRSLWESRFWTPERLDRLRNSLSALDTADRKPYSLASRIIDDEASE
jgi:LAO/AO transport system kinase